MPKTMTIVGHAVRLTFMGNMMIPSILWPFIGIPLWISIDYAS